MLREMIFHLGGVLKQPLLSRDPAVVRVGCRSLRIPGHRTQAHNLIICAHCSVARVTECQVAHGEHAASGVDTELFQRAVDDDLDNEVTVGLFAEKQPAATLVPSVVHTLAACARVRVCVWVHVRAHVCVSE